MDAEVLLQEKWTAFVRSGSVSTYLDYVNARKGQEGGKNASENQGTGSVRAQTE